MRWLVVSLAAVIWGAAWADVVYLRNGQKVEGKVLKDDWVVRLQLPSGAVVEFPRADVEKVEYTLPPQEEFKERFKALSGDDAEGFFRLGLWAKRHGMSKEAQICFERALKIEPDHTGARLQLGYVRVGSEWLQFEEAQKKKGLVKYKGRWMTKEEAERLKFAERKRHMTKVVENLITRFRSRDPLKAKKAEKEFAKIKDPAAIEAIAKNFPRLKPEHRLLVIETLKNNFKAEDVGDLLIGVALRDPEEDVRKEAALALRHLRCTWAYAEFIKALFYERSESVRDAASDALGYLRDSYAIEPLIAGLCVKVGTGRALSNLRMFSGTITSRVVGWKEYITPRGKLRVPIIVQVESGTSVGGGDNAPTYIENGQALHALKHITGVNFWYEKDKWRKWWAENKDKFDRFMNPKK